MAITWTRPGYRFDPHTVPALPISEYGDPVRYAQERHQMFRPGTGLLYLGHDLLLPGKGHMRADGDNRVLLTCDDNGAVRALSNLCTHALRPIAATDEFIDKSCVTCPYHQWSYRRDGTLIGGRDITFGEGDEGLAAMESLSLPKFETLTWRGFHFAVDPIRADEFRSELDCIEADFAARDLSRHLDFTGWRVIASEDTHYTADWKAFLEVFGDCYHVPPYHDGLASFSDCNTLEWTFGEHYHVQFLKIAAERGNRSALYMQWIEGLERYYAARHEPMSDFAVAWAGIYPNLMIELYNGLRVISIVIPTGPTSHINRAHYCVPDDMEALVPGLPAVMKGAFDETGEQDFVLVNERQRGIDAARELDMDYKPYHMNLTGPAPEAGTAHFFAWWRRQLRITT